MNPFAEMPTHELNDWNAALWLLFFAGFVIVSMAQSARRRPRHWRKTR